MPLFCHTSTFLLRFVDAQVLKRYTVERITPVLANLLWL